MNLNNFGEFIEQKIVDRGFDYYKCGYVESLEFEDGVWFAEVSGNDDYRVEVQLSKNGDIESSCCDCPYEFGEYCKHEVAVFYALKNLPEQELKSAKTPKTNLKKILLTQSVETLTDILLEYASKNRFIKSDLLLRFSDAEKLEERARDLIRTSVKNAMRRGFVEYGHTRQAIEGADRVLDMAATLAPSINKIKLLIVVLEETMELLDYCDDSSGDVGGVIESAVSEFSPAISEFNGNQNEKEEIFNLAVAHANSSVYNGWSHWRISILEMCIPFCDNLKLRTRLEEQLKQCFYNEYGKNHAQKVMLKIITEFDGEESANKYRSDNLDNSDFRRSLIENALSNNDLEKALNLCTDGIETDSEHQGLVAQWQRILYEIYERMSDISAQRELAKQFILDGDFDYFAKFKVLYSYDEWTNVLDELINEFGGNNKRGVYVKILIAENLKSILMEYCKENIRSTTELYQHLLPEYKEELFPLFDTLIRKSANSASNRNEYKTVCGIIRHFKKACGASAASEIIDEFLDVYKKRPAFVDELRKIKI